MTLDLSTAWQVIADPQTVTYYRKTSRTAYAAAETVQYVLVRGAVRQNVGGRVLLKERTLVIHMWADKISVVPKPQDAVEYGGKRYTVDRVQVQSHGQRYRLEMTEE